MRASRVKLSLLIFLAILQIFVLAPPSFCATRLLIGTGGMAGVYYPIGGAISNIINEKVPNVESTIQTSAAGLENLRLLSLKEIDMALVGNSDAYYAFNGLSHFVGKPITNIRGVAVLYGQPIQIVVRKGSGIKMFEDLKGKRVGVGAPGSGDEAMFRLLLEAFKMSYDDLDEKLISYAEQSSQFKDRHIDSMWYVSGVPASGILDVASVLDIDLVNITGESRDRLIEMNPYFVKTTLPAGLYPGLENDIETVAAPAYLICLESLSNDDVYNITKAMFENLDMLARSHKQGEYIKLETALEGSTIPLHPGAERFYKEKGMIQ